MRPPRRIPQVLLLIETSRAYGRGLVEGIAHYAEKHGPWSIQFDERGLTDPLPRWLGRWRGDGIISRSTCKRDTDRLRATGLPVVEVYSYYGSTFPSVRPDETQVARLAVEHFLDQGLQNFAFFCAPQVYWSNGRHRAFEQALRQRGYACHCYPAAPKRRASANPSRRGDGRNVVRWLRQLPKPCGVLCAADFFAAQLLQTCWSSGIAVPDEIAVLGVDTDPVFCGTSLPRLSSIDLGSARIGYETAALLDRIMRKQPMVQRHIAVAPQRVVACQSTDVLAIDDPDVVQAVRYIRAHAGQRLRVTEIATAVGLSRRTIEQRFQRYLHRSPKADLLRVRMERAEALLATSADSVARIAKLSGFTSPKYFARAFRKRNGMSPKAYRKREQRGRSD